MARAGFRVFPLIPGDKKPAVERFPIVATTDEAQIQQWWGERPDCNIGVSTSGFVVIDIDTKKGAHALQNYYANGGDFNTFVVQTATGGYHCYYTGPNSSLAVDVVPGIDIRSHGGFVVGPGSVTASRNEGCVDGAYAIVSGKPLAKIPITFELLLKPPREARQRLDDAERDTPVNIQNAKTWLQSAEPAIEGKGGNNLTFRVCAKIVRDFALTPETAYQLLALHYNERCIPPWQPGELWQLVLNADAYGSGDLGVLSPDRQLGAVTIIEPPPVAQEQVYSPSGVHLGNAVAPDKQVARPWCVERLLMRGEVSVLGGMGSAGKSMFELTAAAHFAQGKDFGAFKLRVPHVPLRVLIYNGEDDVMEASRRLSAICNAYNFDYNVVIQNIVLMDDRQGDLIVCYLERGVARVNEQATNFISTTLKNLNIDIGIFDPYVNLHGLNESDNVQMRFCIMTLRNIARSVNACIWIAHHTSKGSTQKEKGDADAFRGAGALVNSSRVALLLSSLTKGDKEMFGIRDKALHDYFRIDPGKSNYDKKTGEAVEWLQWQTVRHIAGDLIGVPMIANMRKRQNDQDAAIGAIIVQAMRLQGVGAFLRTDAARAIKASGHIAATMSETSLRNLVELMFERPLTIGTDTLVLVTENGKDLIKLT